LTLKDARLASILVFLIALLMLVVVTHLWGSTKKFRPGADADQYLAIARSLASGHGYKNLVGPWPDLPDYSRMPAWPFLVSIGLRIAPGREPEAVSRFTNAVCLSFAGAFFCILCRLLMVGPVLSMLAGLAVSLSPSLVFLSVDGFSEVCFVMILAIGLTTVLSGGRWIYLGALILGTAALARTNFVLVPLVFFGLTVIFQPARAILLRKGNLAPAFAMCLLTLIPALAWAIRNDLLVGRFPLLSSIEGETFYGANNDVVAFNLEHWGYWVFPDVIPNETPKLQLAQRLGTDLALNDYYHRQGMAWIKANLRFMPRLELGKFVRAFVPIPWVPLTASYVAFGSRFILYVLWILLMPHWWQGFNRTYVLFCIAMAIVHVVTTAVYYGIFRFTHCYIEILFIPPIAFGLQRWLDSKEFLRALNMPDRNRD
jgi:hypothetical protein